MAKFSFRLDPVLDHRQRMEDEQQVALAASIAALRAAEAQRDDYLARRAEMRDRLLAAHAEMDTIELRATYAHCDFLDRAIAKQLPIIAAAQTAVSVERAKLVLKVQAKKVLEVLKERRRETFVADAIAADQRESDEINARHYQRITTSGEYSL
jgi:flagellar export protein FliJ